MRSSMRVPLAAGSALALIAVAGCSGGGGQGGGAGDTIVAATSFSLQTIDPARQFEFTGSTLDYMIYQTALEFEDGDLSAPVPSLTDFEMSDDQKELTLTLQDTGATFADGSAVEIDDIVFSYQRLQGIGGNPAFFLDGVTVEKVDDETMTLTSEDPNPELPFILPNPSLGIVNSEVVEANGGTTDDSDGAEQFLNENSQGSGAYQVESYDPNSEIVLTANEHYSGPEPTYKRVVFRNVAGETQVSDVQAGQAQVAYDLNADQVATLDESAVHINSIPSTYSVYVFMNQDEETGGITADPDFQEAMRYAIDYEKVLDLAGEGAQKMGGVVPNELLGAAPSDGAFSHDLDKAQEALEASGYDGEPIPFHYGSDNTVSGVTIATVAETIQADLAEAGINIELTPAPSTTQLDGFRAGEQPMGIGTWGADYPDPSNYEVFLPDNDLGDRVNYAEGQNPKVDELAEAAASAGEDERGAAFEELYTELNESGPWIPLVQPVSTMVVNKSIDSFVSNADVSFDFATAE